MEKYYDLTISDYWLIFEKCETAKGLLCTLKVVYS